MCSVDIRICIYIAREEGCARGRRERNIGEAKGEKKYFVAMGEAAAAEPGHGKIETFVMIRKKDESIDIFQEARAPASSSRSARAFFLKK